MTAGGAVEITQLRARAALGGHRILLVDGDPTAHQWLREIVAGPELDPAAQMILADVELSSPPGALQAGIVCRILPRAATPLPPRP